MPDIAVFCEKNEVKYKKDVSASSFSTFKIGGVAPFVIYPDNAEKMSSIIRLCSDNNVNFKVLGNCSNVLFPDGRLNFIIIKTDNMKTLVKDEDRIKSGAGVILSQAAGFAQTNGLSGMECLFGIPGSVGGAVSMNAGAYGGEMSQIVETTEYIDLNGCIKYAHGDEHTFGYRASAFQKGNIVTSTVLRLKQSEPDEIKRIMSGYMAKRISSQPLEFPSAGSVFKRPEGYFAGKLIEDCGLKGTTVGGAQVSEKHAGFIINKGGATSEDVKQLIELIQNNVYNKFGVTLETEIRIF